MSNENVLTKHSKEVFFCYNKREHYQDFLTQDWFETEEEAKKYMNRWDKNDGGKNRQIFKRSIIQLNKAMLKEISDANPLEALKDLGFSTNQATKDIFNTLYKFVMKYKNFLDLYEARLLLPTSFNIDNGVTISLPLELFVFTAGDDTVLFMMNDSTSTHYVQTVSWCNGIQSTAFYWHDKVEPTHFIIYNKHRGDGDKTPPTLNTFHTQLETLIFDPVDAVMRDKDEIFAEIHKGRPSWRYFFEKGDYLQGVGRGILSKRLKGMKEETIEFVNDVVRNEFQKAYTKKTDPKEPSAKPAEFLDWLEKHPKAEFNYNAFYDFCIENRCYDLCDDNRNFGESESYTRAGSFSRDCYDDLYERLRHEFATFAKMFLKFREKRGGHNYKLVEQFANEIIKTACQAVGCIPNKKTIREERRKQAEADAKRRREEEEARRYADLDDWD